ncbi:ribonuclease R [Paludicola sp. MB14-C6]|uniref:ribonuclease R n=1 Tax=Paludihabitans sp. MB14-C6 TaxID=3070656 RepID=UPI0027DC8E76|nr:ribonuclease R [Paludicola sp. MB14-C6]WMJ23947.1 ribonuclease R [Paludicola sp. MB14-C6]
MNQNLIRQINKNLLNAQKRGMSFRELAASCGVRSRQQREFRECLRFLEAKGKILDRRLKLYHTEYLDLSMGTVSRLMNTFGFVTLKDGTEVFVPGKYFLGAMPGDTVLVSPIKARGDSPEGEIVKILKHGEAEFTGVLCQDGNGYYIEPDNLVRFNMPINKRDLKAAKIGDKVRCVITERGLSHSDHKIEIVETYGDSQTAANCAQALLDVNGITVEFSQEVLSEARNISKRGVHESDFAGREDFRNEIIFTIDSADTKDIDDAISLKKIGSYYELGVHIADVSHYVKLGSALEKEAYERGTSIYFANRVVPMLPKELSNDICSLNENVDRLTFSCLMTISEDGKLVDFDFKKSIIHSRVKGVYKEINRILNHTEDDSIKQKYSGLYDTLFLMKELANILTRNKLGRGSPEIETSESYIVLGPQGTTVDILPRTRGESEVMIEEFMLMANEAAASAAKLKQVPFVYRVHEPPSEDKINNLHTALSALGVTCNDVKLGMEPKVLSRLINQSKGEKIYPIVNMLVLRSMSKAKYHEVPIGHFGLVLENYAQFTSPIRRYPDLTIHRVLSELVKGTPSQKVTAKFEQFVVKSARRSTETELNAMKLERQCDDCYKAEYMKLHIGEEFEGIISSVAPHGIYVMLPNTVEGLVKVSNLPQGQYDFDEMFQYKNLNTNQTYRIGDSIKVRCISVDVSAGNIDFETVE